MEINLNTKYKINYVAEHTIKKQITVHHTVGGTAISSINYWNTENNGIGCPYIIERDGTIYQLFDPTLGWIYHLGIALDDKRCSFTPGIKYSKGELDKLSIGIELASEGGLYSKDNKLYNFKIGNEYKGSKYIKLDNPWRGFQYFDQYEDVQLQALANLINYLLNKFPTINRTVLTTYDTVSLEFLKTFSGVNTHYHFRKDKTDVNLAFSWEHLADTCRLAKTNQLGQMIADVNKLIPSTFQRIST